MMTRPQHTVSTNCRGAAAAGRRTAPTREPGRRRTAPTRWAGRRRGLLVPALAAFLLGACSLPRWPVDGTVTSAFGLRLRGWRPDLHHGVDVYAPEGTPVRAMRGGHVEHAGAWGSYGLSVVIEHGGGVRTLYAHLSRVDVRAGERVRGRQPIGAVGRTGNATGPHLHFEVWRWGRPEDPVPLLGGFPAQAR